MVRRSSTYLCSNYDVRIAVMVRADRRENGRIDARTACEWKKWFARGMRMEETVCLRRVYPRLSNMRVRVQGIGDLLCVFTLISP